ncbi:MAG: acyl carrier protein [Mycoplasmataceae bacterium]|nr:acyl carrier protein [Mycoplasmataceae bacterium]MBR3348339.1 acyl carrier protein [Mycoplasmataceae bacterium]
MNYKDEIFKMIKEKTTKNFDENTPIRDLGLDSIDMVEMIADFEDKFNIEIPSEKINSIKTIKNLLDIIDKI